MLAQILPSLKDRIEKKGLNKEYRSRGINRATRRVELSKMLKPGKSKGRHVEKPSINCTDFKAKEKQKESLFGTIKKRFGW